MNNSPTQAKTGLEWATRRDAESGNDYALARSYANSQGRFLSPDPLEGVVGDPQSWNRYAYVENDPINLSDPSGQGFWEDLGFAIADIFLAIFAPEALPSAELGEVDATQVQNGGFCANGPFCAISRLVFDIGPAVCAAGVCYTGGGSPVYAPGSGPFGNTPESTRNNPDGGLPNSNPGGGQGAGTTDIAQNGAGSQGPGNSGSDGGNPGGKPTPTGGGTSGPVLYPVGSGKPYIATWGGIWGKDWLLGHMGRGGSCCTQTPADKKTMVTLREQFNGKGPWVQGGKADPGGFHDILTPEARTITQRFFLPDGQQLRVVLGYDQGKLIVTKDIKVVVHGGYVPPTYLPFP